MRFIFSLTLVFCLFIVFFNSCQDKKTNTSTTTEIIKDSTISPIVNNKIDISFFKKDGDHIIIPWKYLMNVKFEQTFKEDMSMEVSLPIFNDTLKMLDGKNVMIEGFYIPVDETGDDKIVIVSAYPFSQCFFCGKAGVESIIDVLSPKKLPTLKVV